MILCCSLVAVFHRETHLPSMMSWLRVLTQEKKVTPFFGGSDCIRILGKANSNFQDSRFLGSVVMRPITKFRVFATVEQQEIGSDDFVGMWVLRIGFLMLYFIMFRTSTTVVQTSKSKISSNTNSTSRHTCK